MIHLFHIEYGKTNRVNVVYDSNKNLIHLLEMENNQESHQSVNEVLQSIRAEVLLRINTYGGIHPSIPMRWLFYNMDGNVSEVDQDRCLEMGLDNKDIYLPYVQKMLMRRICSQINH